MRVFSQNNKPLFTDHELTFNDEFFIEETKFIEGKFLWHSIEKIYRDDNYIIITLGKNYAFIVPRNAFQEFEAWDHFYHYVYQRSKLY